MGRLSLFDLSITFRLVCLSVIICFFFSFFLTNRNLEDKCGIKARADKGEKSVDITFLLKIFSVDEERRYEHLVGHREIVSPSPSRGKEG